MEKVLLNGKDYANSWVPLSALGAATTDLRFQLSAQPNEERGQHASQRPPSFMGDVK